MWLINLTSQPFPSFPYSTVLLAIYQRPSIINRSYTVTNQITILPEGSEKEKLINQNFNPTCNSILFPIH